MKIFVNSVNFCVHLQVCVQGEWLLRFWKCQLPVLLLKYSCTCTSKCSHSGHTCRPFLSFLFHPVTYTHTRKYGKRNATMKWYLCCDKTCWRTIKHLSVINLFRIRSLSAASSNSDKTSHCQCWSLIHSHSSSISSLFMLSFSCTSHPFAVQRKFM